jgi:hypothetical protein
MNMHVPALALSAMLVFAAAARAQDEPPLKPVRAYAGGGLIIAAPVGEFDTYIGTGWGAGGHFALKLDRFGILSLRADAGFVNYGHETKRVCLSTTVGCRIQVDLTTSNDIAYFNLGPQLAVAGGPVQPYINASIGLAYFATVSSVNGTGNPDTEDFARTTNFDDITFAWQAGTGLRIPLAVSRTPIYIDLGARYNLNGRVEYLREGGITDNPDGSITLDPITSDANLVTFVIGASFGIRW